MTCRICEVDFSFLNPEILVVARKNNQQVKSAVANLDIAPVIDNLVSVLTGSNEQWKSLSEVVDKTYSQANDEFINYAGNCNVEGK